MKLLEALVLLLALGLFVWWQLRDLRMAREHAKRLRERERQAAATQSPDAAAPGGTDPHPGPGSLQHEATTVSAHLKIIHLLCACLFPGNVIVSGVWAALAERTGRHDIIKFSNRLVLITDCPLHRHWRTSAWWSRGT